MLMKLERWFTAVLWIGVLVGVVGCTVPEDRTVGTQISAPAPAPTEAIPTAAATGSDGKMQDSSPLPIDQQNVSAANADVLFVSASQGDEKTWRFTVTVEHPDKGWDDYADGWDVVLPDGTVVKPDSDSPFTRLLLHPHENEQPFTRSQSGITIEPGITKVRVRAHDIVDGFGGREVVLDLTRRYGPDYEVQRLDE